MLTLFDSRPPIARHQYLEFVGEAQPSSVLQKIRSGSSEDDRSLGDDDWHKLVLKDVHPHSKWESLDQLIEQRCKEYGITETELVSASRARDRAALRARIALEATDCGLCSVTEIARRFARSQPALSRAINRRRRQQKKLKSYHRHLLLLSLQHPSAEASSTAGKAELRAEPTHDT